MTQVTYLKGLVYWMAIAKTNLYCSSTKLLYSSGKWTKPDKHKQSERH